jgi:hypothetical protein
VARGIALGDNGLGMGKGQVYDASIKSEKLEDRRHVIRFINQKLYDSSYAR